MNNHCSPHAQAAYVEWAAIRQFGCVDEVNGQDLSIADVIAVAW